ncbi:MAG TPA: hypothetical protein PLE99_17005 [Candidatus Thiothrix moscowensis]|uniref:hypothetical protein n=1 Tax=unclassified Thiothrix TaxID=2636184 RepID=UPI0025DA69A6|nr:MULTISPECIES: hypothetical protein [unclassified Thiothrix]HRJ54463.1 hypothetical protein [Candidatus Thiothrix moscowensis]HRJ94836.1 hypothetical protein [Candidatus Thiothrix moscowensis]
MKHYLSLLAVAGILFAPLALAEKETVAPQNTATEAGESNSSAVADLCKTYAIEDGIAAAKQAAYINDCMASMTDLSGGVQEPIPLVAEGTGEPVAAPASEKVNSDPEQLVKSELVETPDPTAEQLDAKKN